MKCISLHELLKFSKAEDFSGDPSQNCYEILLFVIFRGVGDSGSADVLLASFHFFIVAPIVVEVLRLSLASNHDERGHLRGKKSVADNIYFSVA